MNLKDTLQLAWTNRAQIADSFYNTYINNKQEIAAEAQRRRAICESNVCGYYDAEGKPETSAIPGKPACSICHCNIDAKSMCTFCWCALKDIAQEPLWDVIMTKDQADVISGEEYLRNLYNKADGNKTEEK